MTHKERKSVSKESAARRDGRKMKKRMSLRREKRTARQTRNEGDKGESKRRDEGKKGICKEDEK